MTAISATAAACWCVAIAADFARTRVRWRGRDGVAEAIRALELAHAR